MATSSPGKVWPETRTGRIAVIACVVGLFVLVFWLAMKSRRMLQPPQALVVDEQYLSFGEVWEDPAFVWNLPIHNTSQDAVEILSFVADCPCVRIEPRSLTVPAQGTVNVLLTLDLRASPPRGLNAVARDFKVRIKPHLSSRTYSHGDWVVHGKVIQPFVIEPPVLDFGRMSELKQSVLPQRKFAIDPARMIRA